MVNLSTRRLYLSSPELADLDYRPGQDLMLTVGQSARGHVRRRYTIRSFSLTQRQVALDVVLHAKGPGTLWAQEVSNSETVEAIGPRGKITLQQGVAWHLFAGDEAFAPAALTMAEALAGSSAVALVLLVVTGPGHEHPSDLAGDKSPTWLYRADGATDRELLASALRGLQLPATSGCAYLGGERETVAAAHAVLVERGLAPEQILAKAYWRAGLANAPHGEPERS
jgi:NADPH-dependent ferric siderophore reductase